MLTHAIPSDLEQINEILNHPEVFPWVSLGSSEPFAFDEASLKGLWFFLPENRKGVFMIAPLDAENAEVHSAFLPGHRGKVAVDLAWEGMEYLFTRSRIVTLWTKVPYGNRRADALCRLMGWEKMGDAGGFDLWRMDILRWVRTKASTHTYLEDRVAEVANLCFHAGQVQKSVDLYNTLATPAGWGSATIESSEPLRVQLGNSILLHEEKGSIPTVENDPCPQPQ